MCARNIQTQRDRAERDEERDIQPSREKRFEPHNEQGDEHIKAAVEPKNRRI